MILMRVQHSEMARLQDKPECHQYTVNVEEKIIFPYNSEVSHMEESKKAWLKTIKRY